MLVSPHTHIESALSASPIQGFVKKAKELGRTHLAVTDHNMLASFMTAYAETKKQNIKICPGVEVYFKDPACLLTGSGSMAKAKYYKITLFATTQAQFKELSKLCSKTRENKIYLNEENFDLWNWDDLKQAGDAGLLCVGSDLNGLIEKPILLKRADISIQIVKRLKEYFPNRLYLTIVGVKYDKFYSSFVQVEYKDGTTDLIPANSTVQTNAAKRVLVSDLIDSNRHFHVKSKTVNNIFYNVNKDIKSAHPIKAFTPFGYDLQKNINIAINKISEMLDIPVLYSDYAYYAEPKHKIVQDVKMTSENRREYATRHMQSRDEALNYLKDIGLANKAEQILSNNDKFAELFNNFEFKNNLQLPSYNGDINKHIIELIQSEGRMKWSDPVYVERLKKEINVLANNGVLNFLPYFLPIRDVVKFYFEQGVLTGPGRGSAAGSLLVYLLGITHIDPIKYNLSFERFQTLERLKLLDCPDIDQDLPSRDLLVGKDGKSGYLFQRYGNRAAQISNRSMLRLKSSIKDVNRYFNKGRVSKEIEKLTKALPSAPQGVSDSDFVFGFEDSDGNHHPGLIEYNDDLKKYIENYPEEWEVVKLCLGVSRQIGKHASAFVISDNPINEIAPTFDNVVTQWEMKGVQAAGLIKYDFLVVKQLEDIQLAIDLINKKNGISEKRAGYFTHNGETLFIWNLPEDQKVFESIWNGDTVTIFQLHTSSMIPFVKKIKPKSIQDLSDILALVRPGPLDFVDEKTGRNMAEEYIERRYGRSRADIPELEALLPETYAVLCYQEQITRVAREIGQMSAEDAEKLRRLFSKKLKTEALKMKPLFMEGAIKKVGKEKAEKIWGQMETSSRYSFNCLAGDQLIQTKNGLIRLDKIAKNPSEYVVASFNVNTRQIEYETPDFGANQGEKECWTVELDNGSIIKATPDHKFLSNGQWITLSEIVEKGLPIDNVNKKLAINKVLKKEQIPVYDISMPKNHNFILDNGTIAHNCSHSISYATITYACMFLKYYYPLEWLTAVLSNAEEEEITTKLFKHVKDIYAAPDINLSTDKMIIDYNNHKIRAKLTVLKGLGDSAVAPIIANRPYSSIKDFVSKEVAGPSLTKKLIHAGVMDSLFPPNSTLIQKMQLFEDAREEVAYERKIAAGKKPKPPKKGTIDPTYIGMHPIKDFCERKKILPTMPASVTSLMTTFSNHCQKTDDNITIAFDHLGRSYRLLSGEEFQKIEPLISEKNIYFAMAGYVLKAKEFDYQGGSKKALKINIDCDGYITEQVMWPEYDSGELKYPEELKEGVVGIFFFKKREGKPGCSIQSIIVEEKSLT
jgi:DNA polymerase-3 subunit alpha